jgi:hypothetical protein
MPVDDMKIFLHQTLASLADTLDRSTSDSAAASELRDFALHFSTSLGLRKP